MKTIFGLLIIFLLAPLANAANTEWSLQITDYDYDLHHQKLPDDKVTRPYLKKTGWRCTFGKTEVKGDLVLKSIQCNFSVAKTGEIRSTLSCSKDRPYGELKLELIDERRTTPPTVILLMCRQTP